MSSKDKWSKNFKYIEETLIEMNQLLERVVLTQKFESDQLKLNEEILEINHLVTNVINFYIDKKSSSITGQYLALGGLHR